MWRLDFQVDYGKMDSEYGLVIDHIKPVSEGGSDDISNLRPVHWENTTRNEDGTIVCTVIADSVHNVRRTDDKFTYRAN